MNFIPLFFYSLAFFVLAIYVLIMIKAIVGMKKTTNINSSHNSSLIKVDVIIAYRNEAAHLPNIIQDLKEQSYSNFRVIWIDDHSEDEGEQIIKDQATTLSNVFLSSKGNGKKSAIRQAVDFADASLLLFTDADCRIPTDWVKEYKEHFEVKNSGLFFGPVVYNAKNWLQKVFALEFLSLTGTGMGLAAGGFPVYMNGANYAISNNLKSAFSAPDGHSYVSGDDVFLMHSIKKMHGKIDIVPVNKPSLTVMTDAPNTLLSFLRQRIRWGGKTVGYKDIQAFLLAFTVFLICLFQVAALFLIRYWMGFIVLWGVKILTDFISLSTYSARFRKKNWMWLFLPTTILYPFYIVAVSFIANFSNKTRWHK